MVLQPLPTSPAKLVDPPLIAGVQSQCPSPGIISFLFKKKKNLFGSTGSQLQHLGSSLLQHVGSGSLTRDQTQAPWIESAES